MTVHAHNVQRFPSESKLACSKNKLHAVHRTACAEIDHKCATLESAIINT